jgi:excisionase family DNA binding protein
MEKISIARRRLEKKKAAVYVKNKPDDPPSEMNWSPSEASYTPPEASYTPPEANWSPSEASCSSPKASCSPSAVSNPSSMESSPPPELSNKSQQADKEALQTPPVYSLDSLLSFINEEGGLLELSKKQFSLEIVSGVEKPIKMLVSIQPLSGNSNSPYKRTNYEEGYYLTPEEAAQTLKVSKNTIYRQLKEGSLRGLKIGCRWRVLLSPQGKTEGSERGNG